MKKQLIAAIVTSLFGVAALTSTSFAGTGNGHRLVRTTT